ncbi:MAG: hypothetical protein JHC70_13435 [Rhodococcus sp.]|nr:hypothetical protein [Rhodococcus sp. (in: high G+C Gram-positive bacteria)]MBJ7323330.1 hypothetical protein [Rhodococcus sp. (in: high G+C Gram-positive bacteria)]
MTGIPADCSAGYDQWARIAVVEPGTSVEQRGSRRLCGSAAGAPFVNQFLQMMLTQLDETACLLAREFEVSLSEHKNH